MLSLFSARAGWRLCAHYLCVRSL